MTRQLVLRWPDWAAVAAAVTSGPSSSAPAAVFHANRVVAATPAARHHDVTPGVRRRDAQARCPSLTIHEADTARDARAFEPILHALDVLTPRIELTVPGTCAFATRGPSRYWGGDDALAARAFDLAVSAGPAGPDGDGALMPSVAIADTGFTARVAALVHAGRSTVIAPGESAAFLAPLPVAALLDGSVHPPTAAQRELVDLLTRLGLRTLGSFAALDAGDVTGRFGPVGVLAHRCASGLDDTPLAAQPPPPELAIGVELDPPAEQVAQVAFVVRASAEELHDRLAAQGLACTRIVIEAETEHGEHHARMWRQDGALRPAAIVERLRWQLDAWLSLPSGATNAPTAGVSFVRLIPDEVIPDDGRQLGFWGGATQADERAHRGIGRLSAMVGHAGVLVPEWRGGRGPSEQLVLVPAETVDLAARVESPVVPVDAPPWPGRIPPPHPATVYAQPIDCALHDGVGRPALVGARGAWRTDPSAITIGERTREITSWSSPWLYDERWWDPLRHHRRVRAQVVLDDGTAHLLVAERGRWQVEATYD
jgi:protein ImuB